MRVAVVGLPLDSVTWSAIEVRKDATSVSGLADFYDAGHFYNWGFFLPLCKPSGLSMNTVRASEPLAVLVKQGNLPMMEFSPLVCPK
jgi:hypothetical protein